MNKLPVKIMEEIEAAYVEEYLLWTNIDGPSLLGTMSDYYRFISTVLEPFEEEHPEIANHYDEIRNRLKEINPRKYKKKRKTSPLLISIVIAFYLFVIWKVFIYVAA